MGLSSTKNVPLTLRCHVSRIKRMCSLKGSSFPQASLLLNSFLSSVTTLVPSLVQNQAAPPYPLCCPPHTALCVQGPRPLPSLPRDATPVQTSRHLTAP